MKMKLIGIAVLSLSISFIFLLAGCQKQKNSVPASPDLRQTRLTADENHRLRSQVQKSQAEITKLNQQLEDCRKEKANVSESSGQSVSFILEQTKKETAELQQENANLKGQIQKLESELKNSKP
jgi:uncharacterized protein (DUF3084 family)